MRSLAVLAEALAVVAEDHDKRGPAGARLRDSPEQPACLGVGVRHFAVVGIPARARPCVGRRRVGRMRIIEVGPHEVRPARRPARLLSFPQPGDGAIGHRRRRTLRFEVERCARGSGDLIVVGVEPWRQAELAIEHERADEGGRLEAGVLEQRRERRARAVEAVHAVQPDACRRRNGAGHQADVRRKRERHGRARGEEPRAASPTALMAGVSAPPTRSARSVSTVIRTTSGDADTGAVSLAGRAHAADSSRPSSRRLRPRPAMRRGSDSIGVSAAARTGST